MKGIYFLYAQALLTAAEQRLIAMNNRREILLSKVIIGMQNFRKK